MEFRTGKDSIMETVKKNWKPSLGGKWKITRHLADRPAGPFIDTYTITQLNITKVHTLYNKPSIVSYIVTFSVDKGGVTHSLLAKYRDGKWFDAMMSGKELTNWEITELFNES